MKIPAIISAVFISFFLCLFFLPHPLQAATVSEVRQYEESQGLLGPMSEKQEEVMDYTEWSLANMVAGGVFGGPDGMGMNGAFFLAFLGGGGPLPVTTLSDGTPVYNRGALGAVGNMVGQLIAKPPVSTVEYVADLGSSLGVAKPAYAQTTGIGWQALSPVLALWKAFRNVAYLIFVLIFIVVGFMIMFRAKINPQTVISVQAALPNLIITLILITFSYAIASLLIDLIYVLIYLGVGIFSMAGVFSDGGAAAKEMLFNKSLMQLAFTDSGVFLGQSANSIGDIVNSILGGSSEFVIGETGAEKIIPGLAGQAFSLLAYLIILFAVIFSMFKLLFQLLISYIGIIIGVIFAPFQILFNALPGSNSFMNWLKTMLSNILVFPAAGLMFLLARIVVGVHSNIAGWSVNEWALNPSIGSSNAVFWQPPLLQTGNNANGILGLIGVGFILLTPKVVQMVKDALKVEKGKGYGGYALGQMMGVPGGVIGTPLNTAMQIGQAKYYLMGNKGQTDIERYLHPSSGAPMSSKGQE